MGSLRPHASASNVKWRAVGRCDWSVPALCRKKLQSTHPRENVDYLVLSGGLGSSPYVQRMIRMRYEMGADNYPNAANLKILKAPKPQITVVLGLVMDRVSRYAKVAYHTSDGR